MGVETQKIKLTDVSQYEEDRHDDMLGYIITGISGANQWLVANIGDTLFPMQWLRNNSSDYYCTYIQSPHTRKQGALIDSIHIHYILQTDYVANQTLVFDVSYTWITPGMIIPNIAGWNTLIGVPISWAENREARYSGAFSLVSNFPAPSPDGYGAVLLVRVVRGNGTYSGNLGILACDAHVIKDREGSKLEFSDV